MLTILNSILSVLATISKGSIILIEAVQVLGYVLICTLSFVITHCVNGFQALLQFCIIFWDDYAFFVNEFYYCVNKGGFYIQDILYVSFYAFVEILWTIIRSFTSLGTACYCTCCIFIGILKYVDGIVRENFEHVKASVILIYTLLSNILTGIANLIVYLILSIWSFLTTIYYYFCVAVELPEYLVNQGYAAIQYMILSAHLNLSDFYDIVTELSVHIYEITANSLSALMRFGAFTALLVLFLVSAYLSASLLPFYRARAPEPDFPRQDEPNLIPTRSNCPNVGCADIASVECIICLSATKNIAFLPCRHVCVCSSCAASLNPNLCPMCRSRITKSIVVYI